MLRLFFLRHGQTAMSRANVFCGRRLDPPLTPEGITMAEEFAAAYRELEGRAIAPAQPRAAAVGLPIEKRDELAELDYGAWDGMTADEVALKFHIEHERWIADPARNPPPGGEAAA